MKNMLGEELSLQEAVRDYQAQLQRAISTMSSCLQTDYGVGVATVEVEMISIAALGGTYPGDESDYICNKVRLGVKF